MDLSGRGNPSEKRKVDSSILSLTTTWKATVTPSHLRKGAEREGPMAQAAPAWAKIPTKKPTTVPFRGN